jgi:hypothetical protein
MTDSIYCKYCNQTWQTGIRYDKHLRMCEFFYQDRRNPRREMDERGAKIPTMRELYRYVKDLSNRLEKTEKELARVKSIVNSKHRRSIIEWLNKPSQTPPTTFENWVRTIHATEDDMLKVIHGDLMDGVLSCLDNVFQSSLPIRSFSQKPGTLYVYCSKSNKDEDDEPKTEWRIMSTEQVKKIIDNIAKSIRIKYRSWENANIIINTENDEYDQSAMDRSVKYMQKINADTDKKVTEFKKTIFSKLEEDLHIIMECEFE